MARLSRRSALLVLGVVALIGLAAVPFSLLTAQPQPQSATETRAYILRLLTDLHSTQPGVAPLAEQRLLGLGVSQSQLQYARLLRHPDRFERFRLVSLLPQIDDPLRTELRIELTRDVDREVRASVINMTQPDTISGPLASRLDEMLRHEPDTAIRRRVEQLIGGRRNARPAAAEFSGVQAQSMRLPVSERPIEVHATSHRPLDTSTIAPGASYLPPGNQPVRQVSAEIVAAPGPVMDVPLTLPVPTSAYQPQLSVVSPEPLPLRGPDSSQPPPNVNPIPQSSGSAPVAPTLTPGTQRPTSEPDTYNSASGILPVSALPVPGPQPAPAYRGPAPGTFPIGPTDTQPVPSIRPVPAVSIQPTFFQNIGIPPAPVPAPPAEAAAPAPRLTQQDEPARLIVPGDQRVPAPAPAAESAPFTSTVPAVGAGVLPLFDGPSGGGVVINDPLFQQQPGDGPTSSNDVGARRLLDRPIDQIIEPTPPPLAMLSDEMLTPEPDAPFGFTGPSGIIPNEVQESAHFVPVPDRWRIGAEHQDRYDLKWPWVTDYLGNPGHWWDPYNQNVLKGDYPIIGQHTFMNVMLTSQTTYDFRQTPIGTTPFESTRGRSQEEFFGQPETSNLNQNFFMRFDLFHANNLAFKPLDWQFRITPTVNSNVFHSEELAVINPDVRQGRNRIRDHFVVQEYFAEFKLADLSPDYDFVSVRSGNQLFNSDFRGFIFFDTNRAVRVFGSRFSNRHQFNLLFYDTVEKETNSGLNTTKDRHQNILIANYYVQDFIWPGYTFQTSFHWNNDQPSREFDRNNFLVRPDPTGVFQPHRVEAYYFGIAGDGHIGRINVNNAFYWVTGRDGLNPIAGRTIDINAFMGALELSYDRDWARFRASLFYSSGDDDPSDTDGEGFDSILDNPVFAGGEFSYWQRQAIQLFGVRLVNDRSLVPDLRSSGIQGQSNFVNPGLFLFNLGLDMDLTPKLRSITNANYIMFDETEVLSAYTFQGDIDHEVGLDISTGIEWRPFHNDNAIILAGVSALIPDEGFKDLYNQFDDGDTETLFAFFADVILTY